MRAGAAAAAKRVFEQGALSCACPYDGRWCELLDCLDTPASCGLRVIGRLKVSRGERDLRRDAIRAMRAFGVAHELGRFGWFETVNHVQQQALVELRLIFGAWAFHSVVAGRDLARKEIAAWVIEDWKNLQIAKGMRRAVLRACAQYWTGEAPA